MNVQLRVLAFLLLIGFAVWGSGSAFLGSTGRIVQVWDDPVAFRNHLILTPVLGAKRISLTFDLTVRTGDLTLVLWNPAAEQSMKIVLSGPQHATEIYHFEPQVGQWYLVMEARTCTGRAIVEWQGLEISISEE